MDRTLEPRQRVVSWPVGVGVVLVLLACISGYFLTRQTQVADTELYTVVEGERAIVVRGRALLVPSQTSAISALSEGSVESIKVVAGARVDAGTVLAVLSNPRLDTQLRRAQLAYRNAQASARIAAADLQDRLLDKKIAVSAGKIALRTAQAEYKAYQLLYEKGGVGRLMLEKVQATADQASAEYRFAKQKMAKFSATVQARQVAINTSVDIAREALHEAQANVSGLTITAAQRGTVSKLDLSLGQRLAPGALVGELISDQLHADIAIAQDDGASLRVGQAVSLAAPQGHVAGHIVTIMPRSSDGALHAKAKLDTNPTWLRPDLVCEATVVDKQKVHGLFVTSPDGALANTQATVLVLQNDGQMRPVMVEFGPRFQDELQVERGLQPGDRIASTLAN